MPTSQVTAGRRPRVVEHRTVVRAAVRRFLRHGGLDMLGLADDLAVSRATLYRVAHGREALLGHVLWALTAATLARAAAEAPGDGLERLLATSRRFHELVAASSPLRQWTEQEPELAFRVLFTPDVTPEGGVHARVVQWWAEAFRSAEDAGVIAPGVPAPDLAEMWVRLGESMLWSHLLTARDLDLQAWEQVRRRLLVPAGG